MHLEKNLGAENVLAPQLRGTSVHIWGFSWGGVCPHQGNGSGTNFEVRLGPLPTDLSSLSLAVAVGGDRKNLFPDPGQATQVCLLSVQACPSIFGQLPSSKAADHCPQPRSLGQERQQRQERGATDIYLWPALWWHQGAQVFLRVPVCVLLVPVVSVGSEWEVSRVGGVGGWVSCFQRGH